MKRTFQSFVFGCRVNEAERMKIDKELVEAGFTIDLASPKFLIINTCAITSKAEREARQLIYQLRKQHPEAKIVLTGCSATLWEKYKSEGATIADIIVPNNQKSKLVSLLQTSEVCNGPLATAPVVKATDDKFRHSNRLLVKIQDGCHRFCSYCIVPYLRDLPQSERAKDIISYINSFDPIPSEVVLSAINTEAFGIDTGETLVGLIKAVLQGTRVPRIAFGSIHPWSLTDGFLNYYRETLSREKRFVHFFHVPLQSGSQTVLGFMKREYMIKDVIKKLTFIRQINPNALIATDVIVGFLGETNKFFDETYSLLEQGPISRFHVFRFSNRQHTAAFYQRKLLFEPTSKEKKERSKRLIALSRKKYQCFIEKLVGKSFSALIISEQKEGLKLLLSNQIQGISLKKNGLPGQILHVTIIAAKDGLVICEES